MLGLSYYTTCAKWTNLCIYAISVEINMELQTVKCVLVGDSAVGKTPLITTFKTKIFPEQYVPTVFDNCSKYLELNGQLINLEFWDTSGLEEYDQLRPISYPGTDVFLVCFSLTQSDTLDSVYKKWCPEIKEHCPSAPFILVGTKMDLRDRTFPLEKIIQSRTKGHAIARHLGAVEYMECSALANVGLEEIFIEAIRVVLWPSHANKNCIIL